MKKTGLLAIAFASVFVCAAAAGCGGKDPEEGGESGDQKLSAEAVWEEVAKLDFTNVTITSTVMGFVVHDGNGETKVETVEYHEILKLDLSKKRVSYDWGSGRHTVCAEIDGVQYYFDGNSDGTWSKREDEDGQMFRFTSAINYELGAFSDYTYDEATGKYVTTVVGKRPMSESAVLDKTRWKDYYVKREVTIKDGKLVEFYGEGNDGRTERYFYTDYGTTVVTIPEA